MVTERLREGGRESSNALALAGPSQCCPQPRKKREEQWAQGALWMSAGEETKGSSPELRGHDLCRLEGRSRVTADGASGD